MARSSNLITKKRSTNFFIRKFRLLTNRLFWEEKWWNLKWGVKNIIRYFPVVWKQRDYDYGYVLEMLYFQLTLLRNAIQKGYEVKSDKDKKIKDIDRVLLLIKRKRDDDFIARCGGLNATKYDFDFDPVPGEPELSQLREYRTVEEIEEDSKTIIKAHDLEIKEMEELFNILAKGKKFTHGLYSWWT